MMDLAKAFCLPATRFGATCVAWSAARDKKDFSGDIKQRLSTYLHKECAFMDAKGQTSLVVKLARLAAAVQAKPIYDASANDEQFMFKSALKSAQRCWAAGMRDDVSLEAAIASGIKEFADRRAGTPRGFYSAKANRREGQNINDAILEFARCFVEFWNTDLHGRPPSSAARQLHTGIYRWAFLQAPRTSCSTTENTTADASA